MPLTEEQEDRLESVLHLAGSRQLTTWEQEFLTNLAERYEQQGEQVVVSPKMWGILLRIETKVHRTEYGYGDDDHV